MANVHSNLLHDTYARRRQSFIGFVMSVGLALASAPSSTFAAELHDAVRAQDGAAVEAILAKGVDIEQSDFVFGTALHVAVSEVNTEIAGMLIDHGANLEAVSEQQSSRAMHLAAEFGDVAMLAFLLDRGANIDALDSVLRTPLLRAVVMGHTEAVRHLLDRGAEVDSREQLKGRTPLMIASYMGHLGVVKLLIARGADVNATDTNGEFALYFASGQPSFSTAGGGGLIEYLVAHGADLNARTNAGLSSLDYAKVRGFTKDIAEVLRRLGARE